MLSEVPAFRRLLGMLTLTALSHLDHGLSADHIRFVLDHYRSRDAFFVDTLELPEGLQALSCGLYGPIMGDEPVQDTDVVLQPRSGRPYASRLVAWPARPTRLLTVIAGPHESLLCMLYTSFGGPAAPREPGDSSLTGDDLRKAEEFWRQHALAK